MPSSKSVFLFIILLSSFNATSRAQQTQVKYLSGTDKDHTVQWDFFCTKGTNSNRWTKIAVPSNWELQGFGEYDYGHDKNKLNEQGLYKYKFKAAASWKTHNVFIVFEGSMTDTDVKINGRPAGAIHQGGFYRFKYNISRLLKYGKDNLLEVTVSKASANASINKAERSGDFWAFGGIFRPVYLEVVPHTYIDRIAIDAKADGSFSVDVFGVNLTDQQAVEVQVQSLKGENNGELFSVKASKPEEKITLKKIFDRPLLWNPEFPNLYQAVISIKDARGIIHSVTQKFGFRTAELRLRDGFYVNDTKVMFRGVCRHSEWPETGRTLSKEISILDVTLMKEMNMNAVRMSHYPPDQHFLDVCDSLGLFVLDELTGWQAAYDTVAGRRLVRELVERDVNHPSIVIWDNGNEGGWNRALDNDYALYDPQKRLVIHPWEKFNGTDTKHYPDYNNVVNNTLYGKDVYFPTEFMHGLYDGGHGAGLDDFWNLMQHYPLSAGGFLWSFHDEGVVRTDKNGIMDTHANNAPDGILGPHREKEASYYTIKEIWSPVYIDKHFITPGFNGRLEVENRYLYTNLNLCSFEWKLVKFAAPDAAINTKVTQTGKLDRFALAPGEKGFLQLPVPGSWQESDALYLTAYDQYKKEIFTWSWPTKTAFETTQQFNQYTPMARTEITEQDSSLVVLSDGIRFFFNKNTGYLSKVINAKSTISLSGGPLVAGGNYTLKEFKHYARGNQYVVEPVYQGKSVFNVKWIFLKGAPVKLEYQYTQRGEVDFLGITFNYPEEKITGMKWLGRGPYRVWKNRLKGMQYGVWQKDYNNTITGESWLYPEFKGYHAQLYWVEIQTREAPFSILTEDENVFLEMLKPAKPAGAYNDNTSPRFPEGNIGFMNAINPIGTKFQGAEKMGPQSQKNTMLNNTPISGTLWFNFR
jgi:hypothetical protein